MDIKVEFNIPATMRDGTILRANVFRPVDDGVYPVALSRTPYGKDFSIVNGYFDAMRLASTGRCGHQNRFGIHGIDSHVPDVLMPKTRIRPVPCVSPVHRFKVPITRSGI